jgi:dTDP-4-dehydrorhamnose reductase
MRGTEVKALLFGAYGQLGMAIVDAAVVSGLTLECAPRTLDVTDHPGVTALIEASRPEWMINCAAMTNVDGAHENPQLAMAVNAIGPANIARAAQSVGARVIQISTEAVFDGERTEPYSEADVCRPVSVYGVSKHAGELLVRVMNPESFALRTSWLYSGNAGMNFPTRLLEQLSAHDGPVSVVTDVVGNPTPTTVLAEAVIALITRPPEPGTYHACCMGSVSKYDWAVEIAQRNGFDPSRIVRVTSDNYPTVALRPKHVDLNCEKFMAARIYELPGWRDAYRKNWSPSGV